MSTRPSAPLAMYLLFSASLIAPGCAHHENSIVNGTAITKQALNADAIMRRCAMQYAGAKTTAVAGSFERFDKGQTSQTPVRWESDDNGHTRIEVGPTVALIHGTDWWMLTPTDNTFSPRPTTGKPVHDAAARALTHGAMLPSLKFSLEARTIATSATATRSWQLQGLSWHADRPCYSLVLQLPTTTAPRRLELLIDQDAFLIRAAALLEDRAEYDPQPIWRWSYDTCVLNQPIASGRFALTNTRQPSLVQTQRPVPIHANDNAKTMEPQLYQGDSLRPATHSLTMR